MTTYFCNLTYDESTIQRRQNITSYLLALLNKLNDKHTKLGNFSHRLQHPEPQAGPFLFRSIGCKSSEGCNKQKRYGIFEWFAQEDGQFQWVINKKVK